MIRRAVPIRYDRVAEAGRNRPLLITVETDDGVEHEAFLKASGSPELGVEGLANEAVAASVAGDLGLPINEPFLVELDPNWISAIRDPEIREMLEQSVPVAFASTSAGPQWHVWSAGDRLHSGRRPAALAILAFDAYIANDDRRPSNPNCLVKGNAFQIIDHELAFRIRQKLFPPPEPWRPGGLQQLVGPDGHLFGAGLKGHSHDFASIRLAWSELSEARMREYCALIPPEWEDARPAIETALTHLRQVRDRIDECLAELERALT
jgi:hypothetical protein